MKEVGIYRKAFAQISETFIQEQARSLVQYRPTFISCKLLNQVSFQHVSICQNDFWGIKQAIYWLTRSPHLFNRHDTLNKLGLIHAHFGVDGVYAMALANKLNISFLVTFHGYDVTVYRSAMWRYKTLLYYQLIFHEQELKQKASAFIAVSHFLAKKLFEKGYPKEKIIQHYIGVDTEKFFPLRQEANERYILCVGRHTEKKGIDILLRAFARIVSKHPDVWLVQVGSGSMTRKLHALAEQLGINHRVRFLGAQSHETVLQLMHSAEIFSLPSCTAKNGDSEALGIVFNEASACGIPIVSTWHGGIPEAVLDGETGFLVPEKEDAALADKLDALLSDRALGKKMGQRGRDFVCDVFDIRKQTVKLEAIYDSLL